ncbi:hypothetical protein BHE74_00001134 [Ensete ventricosum]|nr:hypothetical protein GW17_00010986 [Ensete ventricosum]RWW89821.1 hypothetical protein BHE74_00001134 [Ensete ventricosum]RZR90895.1 hypothetical protein BHM03_00018898 [Ensete ventricosum]
MTYRLRGESNRVPAFALKGRSKVQALKCSQIVAFLNPMLRQQTREAFSCKYCAKVSCKRGGMSTFESVLAPKRREELEKEEDPIRYEKELLCRYFIVCQARYKREDMKWNDSLQVVVGTESVVEVE